MVRKSIYGIDIIFCIDATAGMKTQLEALKKGIPLLASNICNLLERQNKGLEQLRMKIIEFRDFAWDENPLNESEFFILPQQNDAFEQCLNGIVAAGGGDSDESALEALALALKSRFIKTGSKYRQIIFLFTDSSAHPLGYGKDSLLYPKDMPESIDRLIDWWNGTETVPDGSLEPRDARLVLYAPDVYPWCVIKDVERCWFVPPEESGDLSNSVRSLLENLLTMY